MKISRLLRNCILTFVSIGFSAIIAFIAGVVYLESDLPNVDLLNDVQLQVPLKIYTSDGKLLGEYGSERRTPVPIEKVPKQLINAILATEDQRFYQHGGVDPLGLLRAAVELITTGTKSQGGSTITMQVARNYFLTKQKTFGRKFREILLAIKIDSTYPKDKILELYLNKIYLGSRAYGVAAAAQVYYGKSLDQLTLPEIAMLAGLPQAPSASNPLVNPVAAKDRRDHVLLRMFQRGFIDKETYDMAVATPDNASYHGQMIQIHAPYVAEMVRDAMVAHYGDDAYTIGFRVYTTINSVDQQAADHALRDALVAYDQRHGYRGASASLDPLKNASDIADWQKYLAKMRTINGLRPAIVTQVTGQTVEAMFANGTKIKINWSGLSWARPELKDGALGATPKSASEITKVGDVIRVIPMTDGTWRLAQIPQVEGALVSLNPQTGSVLALVGGFDYQRSNFNRAIQALRQPGSSFKPFIYAAALDKGYTLATVINDAPLTVWDPYSQTYWRPHNDDNKFNGPTRLRVALSKSMNLVSIRLLQDIGVSYASHYITRFGFDPSRLPKGLSMALGTATYSPLQMASGYAIFANGGYQIQPFIINFVLDGNNKVVYLAKPKVACLACMQNTGKITENSIVPIYLQAPQVLSPQVAFLMTSAMKDVIRHGTGWRARILDRSDLAGKTGTTNDEMDAWFSGFNSDVEATTWVGFDQPQSLNEYGAQAALPMWIEYMSKVLDGKPENTIAQPTGIISAKIDPQTGNLAPDSQSNAIFEFFKQSTVPSQYASGSVTATNADSSRANNSGAPVVDLSQPVNSSQRNDSGSQPLF